MKAIFFIVITLSTVSGVVLFYTKHEVLALEKSLKTVEAKIDKTNTDISVLNAGWAYLTNPQRILELSNKYLPGYQTVSYKQIRKKRANAVLTKEVKAQ